MKDNPRVLRERGTKPNPDLKATKLNAVQEHGEFWIVMCDAEGNEFCLHQIQILREASQERRLRFFNWMTYEA